MAAHQAPPSLGFSRQEHWSGLPFPTPMHECEKWKGSCSVVSNSLRPRGLQPSRLPRPWDFSRQEYWRRLPFPSPGDLPDPGIKSSSHALQADSLLSEPLGKPPSGNFLDLLRGNNFCHRYSYIQVWRFTMWIALTHETPSFPWQLAKNSTG